MLHRQFSFLDNKGVGSLALVLYVSQNKTETILIGEGFQ